MRAFAAWSLVFLLSASPMAQEPYHDWEAVKALSSGSAVRIEQFGGRQVEGRLGSVDDTEITVVEKDTAIPLDRQTIRQVGRVGRQVKRRAGIGSLVGAVGGAILGHSVAEANRGLWTVLMAVGWGAIGTLIGAVDGFRERDYRLVYESPSP